MIVTIRQVLVISIVGMAATACDSLPNSQAPADLIPARVQLRAVEVRHWVSVELNGEVRFQAIMDPASPDGAGPAEFSLQLFRGDNQLQVRWVPMDGNLQVRTMLRKVRLEPGRSYDLSLAISEPALKVAVRDRRNHRG